MKAVGAVAAGRNRKVHMKTVSVTIYCDEGSKGSNPALPQKKLPYGSFYFLHKTISAIPVCLVDEHYVCLLLFFGKSLLHKPPSEHVRAVGV